LYVDELNDDDNDDAFGDAVTSYW